MKRNSKALEDHQSKQAHQISKVIKRKGKMSGNGSSPKEGESSATGSARKVLKSPSPEKAIMIAVTSGVLFNMKTETEPFGPGPALSFVKALEAVNVQLRRLDPKSEEIFDVVLFTNEDAQGGVRLDNTIRHYKLSLERVCQIEENSPISYLKAYHTKLFLSENADHVKEALGEGIAAGIMFTPERMSEVSETQLSVAFDGDAVLFSDESERVFKDHGLEEFLEHEKAHENQPMNDGPMKSFLEVLVNLQLKFANKGEACPIKTSLVTTRDGPITGIRALKTLLSWNLELNNYFFLSGAPKGPILGALRPHIFFDDSEKHVENAANHGIVACHVPLLDK